jgi:hypothetical protein
VVVGVTHKKHRRTRQVCKRQPLQGPGVLLLPIPSRQQAAQPPAGSGALCCAVPTMTMLGPVSADALAALPRSSRCGSIACVR